jgi:small subunit ribosomal protein S25e
MGGGKKKLTLAAIERSQEKKPEKKKDSKSSGSGSERRAPDVFVPDASGKIVDEMKKLKVLTPYVVATRFNLRLSVAKDFLEELEKKGAVQLVSRSRNVRVYRPAN